MEGPRDDEVLVRIVASGICHTDIRYVDDWYEESEGPLVLGHEEAGIVEHAGRKVKGIRRGDHVVLSYQSCGHCTQCRNGRPAYCRFLSELNFGFQRRDGSNALHLSGVRGHFFGQSSFASHTLATERNLVKVPKNIPLEILAPLGCGLQTGAGTVMNSLAVPAGASIAIFGTGGVGLAAVMAARLVGAHPIIGVDRVPARRKLALELGATHAIDSRRGSLTERVEAITGKGVDYAVESTGDGVPDSLPGGRKALSIIQGDAVPQILSRS
jgi:aryl-alcohol dehydrogenase